MGVTMKNARFVTTEVPRGRSNEKIKAVGCNFNKETGKEYEKSQLKNRWDLLKKEWKLWKQLKGNDTCLGWDPNKNNLDTSEVWWEKKLKIMPEATKFKNGSIDPELENKLDWMFQGINDDPMFVHTFGLQLIDGTDDDEPPRIEVEEVVVAVEEIQMPKKAMVRATPPEEEIPGFGLFSSQQGMSTATSAKSSSEPYDIPKAIQLLDNMEEEVPKKSQLYYFATKLFLNKDKRTMFMSLSTDIRAWWLKMEMEEGSKVA
ncbi:Zeta-carotene desaturase [Hibiscus syriacus]|uniref:Zeta-carotene desaturase n=1 Tax=Hibiscus syriacus TaxID=106335 RepID=A0A6A2YY16_HIBSY|nr:Zeta-carotene desaturase [Hibiscus syriacus]